MICKTDTVPFIQPAILQISRPMTELIRPASVGLCSLVWLVGILEQTTTKHHLAETTEGPVPEARAPRPRCRQGRFPPRAVRRKLMPLLLALGGLLAIFGVLWFTEAPPDSCLHFDTALLPCVCQRKFPFFFIRTVVTLD